MKNAKFQKGPEKRDETSQKMLKPFACCLKYLTGTFSETGFYTPPPLEGKIATDILTPFPAPVMYKVLGPIGGGFLCTTGAETENSAVNFPKRSMEDLGLPLSSLDPLELGPVLVGS